jgi:hypothetical protein
MLSFFYRGLFSPEELKKIKQVLEDSDLVPKYGYGVSAFVVSVFTDMFLRK